MHTLCPFASRQFEIPATTAWYVSDLGEYQGKQVLYTRQSPQRLKALQRHALIESAVSSDRIEGVEVEPARVRAVLASPQPLFRDRDEEEVRSYRDALAWIHADAASIAVSDEAIKRLHALTGGQIWDASQFSILKLAYREFEERVGEIKAARGSEREQVLMGIARLGERATPEFSIRELEQACPGVSRDMVRRVLRDEQAAGRLECQGKGPAATWRKKR